MKSRARGALLIAALALSCRYAPAPANGSQLCGPQSSCPAGYHCVAAGTCWRDGEDRDGGDRDPGRDGAATGAGGSSGATGGGGSSGAVGTGGLRDCVVGTSTVGGCVLR
jgi:hypothetical protein